MSGKDMKINSNEQIATTTAATIDGDEAEFHLKKIEEKSQKKLPATNTKVNLQTSRIKNVENFSFEHNVGGQYTPRANTMESTTPTTTTTLVEGNIVGCRTGAGASASVDVVGIPPVPMQRSSLSRTILENRKDQQDEGMGIINSDVVGVVGQSQLSQQNKNTTNTYKQWSSASRPFPTDTALHCWMNVSGNVSDFVKEGNEIPGTNTTPSKTIMEDVNKGPMESGTYDLTQESTEAYSAKILFRSELPILKSETVISTPPLSSSIGKNAMKLIESDRGIDGIEKCTHIREIENAQVSNMKTRQVGEKLRSRLETEVATTSLEGEADAEAEAAKVELEIETINQSVCDYSSHSAGNCKTDRTSTLNADASRIILNIHDSEKNEKSVTNKSGKLCNKLQNNQFIKNQQNAITSASATSKILKYKTHNVLDNPVLSKDSAALTGSPTKSIINSFAIEKKMVAVQELKKTKQNGNHHHHQHQQQIINSNTCARSTGNHHQFQQQQQEQQQSHLDEGALDTNEDLSYGPGIVSKLRCRYLSLALRQSIEKQHGHGVDVLRRTTSLNNLLDQKVTDDDDDETEDDEGEYDVQEVMFQETSDSTPDRSTNRGILKSSNSQENTLQSDIKKTATFQSNAPTYTNGNGTSVGGDVSGRVSQYVKAKVIVETGSRKGFGEKSTAGTKNTVVIDGSEVIMQRSRHVKRGNDSLKRARSVEALLCDKSPWSSAFNRNSVDSAKPPTSTVTSTCVTIEDKIHNARSRLILGMDTMPPKRLTSIIDDTERPPPDLVKQTLKMFEATANRRQRVLNRYNSNGKGEVASKVANYKFIIQENKPAVVLPKPVVLSPTKKLPNSIGTIQLKPTGKPIVAAADLISSPIGRKTIATANSTINSPVLLTNDGQQQHQQQQQQQQQQQHTTSTPKPRAINNSNSFEQISLKSTPESFRLDNTPDVIPRQQKPLQNDGLSATDLTAVDSPVSALTKKLEKLRIDNDITAPNSNHFNSGDNFNFTKEFQLKQQQNLKSTNKISGSNNETRTTTTYAIDKNKANSEPNAVDYLNSFVGGDAEVIPLHDKNNDRAIPKAITTPTTPTINDNENSEGNDVDYDDDDANDGNANDELKVATVNESDINEQQTGTGPGTIASDDDECGLTKRIPRTALENIAKAGTTQQFKFYNSGSCGNSGGNGGNGGGVQQTSNSPSIQLNNSMSTIGGETFNRNRANISEFENQQPEVVPSLLVNTLVPGKQIGIIRPLLNNPYANNSNNSNQNQLTSREIEKNRINDMKKTADPHSIVGSGVMGSPIHVGNSSTSLADNVINTTPKFGSGSGSSSSTSNGSGSGSGSGTDCGYSELDAVTARNSPLWALRKKRYGPPTTAENTSMVFNFSNRKEVPDYIENDGVIFRRKRELPKPNESGFVLLGDVPLETSTDLDYDDYSTCPPSPCDVEFENANIVIDGKSSIRQKSKEATCRVQFNDTLTSTFEYPSEASLIIEDSFSQYMDTENMVNAYEHLVLEETDSPAHQHPIVDEIIQLPTTLTNTLPTVVTPTSGMASSPATKNMLGNSPIDFPILPKSTISQPLNAGKFNSSQLDHHNNNSLNYHNYHNHQTPSQYFKQNIKNQSTLQHGLVNTGGMTSVKRTPLVLNKPQYACFLQSHLIGDKSHSVWRTNSNEFSTNRNDKHFITVERSDSQSNIVCQKRSASFTFGNKYLTAVSKQTPDLRPSITSMDISSEGSAPLGSYTPIKAPIENVFQLGVTRAPNSNGHGNVLVTSSAATTNGNGVAKLMNGNGIIEAIQNSNGDCSEEEDNCESLQYLKPANDELTIAYSEGAQKTDLLY